VYGTRLIVSIIINIVLSGTISIAFAAYRLPPPSPPKAVGARRDGGTFDGACTKPRCFFVIICYIFIPFFFILNTGVGGVGRVQVAHASVRTCTHARACERGISHPLHSHVGPYTGRKLSKEVMRKMTTAREQGVFSFLLSLVPRSLWIQPYLFRFLRYRGWKKKRS